MKLLIETLCQTHSHQKYIFSKKEIKTQMQQQHKIAWVKWDIVCLPKEAGGLGVKDTNSFNLSLLGKWKWSLFQSQGELWARVLESKYGGWWETWP